MLNPPAKDWENTHVAVAAEREGVREENAKVCLKNQKCRMRKISLSKVPKWIFRYVVNKTFDCSSKD